jgi:signal transduction histidine kinase
MLNVNSVRDGEGKILHSVSTWTDMTDLEKAYKELENTNKELQIINKQKDQLFSIIAHDLRNPFNTILGFSDLLKKNIGTYDSEKIKK